MYSVHCQFMKKHIAQRGPGGGEAEGEERGKGVLLSPPTRSSAIPALSGLCGGFILRYD